MSLLEGEKDAIINHANNLMKTNEDTRFLTQEQKEAVKDIVEENNFDRETSHFYNNKVSDKYNLKIMYNIDNRNDKIAEISLLAKTLKILESKLILLSAEENQINNKWLNKDESQLETIRKEKKTINNNIYNIKRQLDIYDKHKTKGGKQKTKNNKFRRRKTKKNIKLKLKN